MNDISKNNDDNNNKEEIKSWADQVDAYERELSDLSINTIDEIDNFEMNEILNISEPNNNTEKWFSKRSYKIQNIKKQLYELHKQKQQQEEEWQQYWHALCEWYIYQYRLWEYSWNEYQQKLYSELNLDINTNLFWNK